MMNLNGILCMYLYEWRDGKEDGVLLIQKTVCIFRVSLNLIENKIKYAKYQGENEKKYYGSKRCLNKLFPLSHCRYLLYLFLS